MASYYMRADGTASSKAEAIGPSSDVTKCMSVATHNVQTFVAGDVIYLSDKGGDFTETILPQSSGDSSVSLISYTNADTESPKVSTASGTRCFYINNKSFVSLSGDVTLTAPASGTAVLQIYNAAVGNVVDGVTINGWANIFAATDVTLSNNVFTGNTAYTIFMYQSDGSIIGNTINNSSANVNLSGIVFDSCTGNVVLSGNTTTINKQISSYSLYILNSTFSSFESTGNTWDNGYSSFYAVNSSGMTFNSDIFSNAEIAGAYMVTGCNSIIFNACVASGNGYDGFDVSKPADTSVCHDITFNSCTAHSNGTTGESSDGDGFSCHGDSYNNSFNNCIAHNNTNTGFANVNTSSGTIYNCIGWANGSDPTSVRGNLFLELDGVNVTTGESWVVKNCIFGQSYISEVFLNATALSICNLDYNCYYPVSSDQFATLDSGTSYISWATYSSSYEPHSINSDPLFIEAGADWGINANSPCRSSGVDVGLTTDFNGTVLTPTVTSPYDLSGNLIAGLKGISSHPAIVNLLRHIGFNAPDLSGMTDGGDAARVVGLVDYTTELEAAGLHLLQTSGEMVEIDNLLGATPSYIDLTGPLSVAAHSMDAHIIGGTGSIGLSDGTGQTAFAASASVVRRFSLNKTPALGTELVRITADAGQKIAFLIPCTVAGSYAPQHPVVANSLITSTTQAANVLELPFPTGSRRAVINYVHYALELGVTRWLFGNYTDANNYVGGGINGTLAFIEKMTGGVSEITSLPLATVSGTEYEVVAGFNPDNTMFITVDGATHTVDGSTTLAPVLTSTFELGSMAGTGQVDGQFKSVEIWRV